MDENNSTFKITVIGWKNKTSDFLVEYYFPPYQNVTIDQGDIVNGQKLVVCSHFPIEEIPVCKDVYLPPSSIE